jgi:ribosome-binding ATPase YchF (GTP1/OBG family)
MERKITITASDGRVFTGTKYKALEDEINVYELELSQKKLEAAERKRKEDEKRKELARYKEKKLKEINEVFKSLDDMIKEYEEKTGMKLYYSKNYCGGDYSIKETTNTIDMAWDNLLEDIIKAVRKA